MDTSESLNYEPLTQAERERERVTRYVNYELKDKRHRLYSLDNIVHIKDMFRSKSVVRDVTSSPFYSQF